jgi:Flp pilus assembly protein TadG
LARLGWLDDRAAQLVEFAVSLPLLVVFVVGIFDFSGAFTLRQKLTNIARDAARAAAAGPATDLTEALPASVIDAYQLATNYLAANNINACGISQSVYITGPGRATWTFTGTTNGCPTGGLTITINRGYYFPQNGGALPSVTCGPPATNGQTLVIATCVSLQYAYAWRFGHAASLLGSNPVLPTKIAGTAVAINEN